MYAAKDDKPKRLEALREATRGFVAIADTPGTQFIEDLCELYPDAKVVCWRRDSQRWWKSMEQMIKHSMPVWLGWYLAPVPGWRWFPAVMKEMSKKYDISSTSFPQAKNAKAYRPVLCAGDERCSS